MRTAPDLVERDFLPGPVFYGGFSSNLIVGVNSFVLDQNCRGVGFAYRTDTEVAIEWINAPDELDEIQFPSA